MSPDDPFDLRSLLRRARAGDAAARNDLLARLRPYLRALVRSWLGPAPARQQEASDVVQETLLHIERGLAGFRGDGVPQFLAWAKRIAHNDAADARGGAAVGGDAAPPDAVDPGLAPPDVLAQAEDMTRLIAALERRPADQRDLFTARVFEGLPYDEIAERLGATPGALRLRFFRLCQELRAELRSDT
jgi:RNA polymerase sigma-70 factor (ECF subfamily)